MFVIDLLLLALSAVIFPDPGMERVFIHAKIARCLSNRLLRLDREFDGAFLKFSGILCRRGLTHRTHLICCVVSVSPCVRKSIATSRWPRLCVNRPSPMRNKPRRFARL